MNKPAKIHIQDQRFKTRALCGRPWDKARGGRVASSEVEEQLVVHNEESGSVNPATCEKCVKLYRERLASPQR